MSFLFILTRSFFQVNLGAEMTFIVFEGGDGVGKSTQINLLSQALVNTKLPFVCTREPGGTPLAEKIREIFKNIDEDSPLPLTEMHLISAARSQHVEKVIRPALSQNRIVVCDRFLDSTYVYQSILGKLSKEIIDSSHKYILKGLLPDVIFILYCPWDIAQSRRNTEEKRKVDRLDSLATSAHQTISKAYETIVKQNYTYPCGHTPKRIYVDASHSPSVVFDQISLILKKELDIHL